MGTLAGLGLARRFPGRGATTGLIYLPIMIPEIVLAVALLTFFSITHWMASPTTVVNGTILPLLFISNVFIPLENPSGWIDVVGKIFPVRHFADAMIGSFFQLSGSGLHTNDLLVLGAWGVAGLVAATRFFDWEPRT